MGTLRIDVGDLHFSARWEPEAPQTVDPADAAHRSEADPLSLVGRVDLIPYGDFRPGIDYENHTSHSSPGMLAMYPGGISECEIFFPCMRACATSSKVGQLAANHFARRSDDGWQDRLREVGRRALWEGAQPIRSARSTADAARHPRRHHRHGRGLTPGCSRADGAAGSARSKTTCRGRRQRIG